MSQQTHKYTRSLKQIVDGLMEEMLLQPEDEQRLYLSAERFLRDLNNDTQRTIKPFRVERDMYPNGLLPMPEDMVGWVRIGYVAGNQIVPLGANERISMLGVGQEQTEFNSPEIIYASSSFPFPNRRGINLNPSPPIPEYRINWTNRTIYMDVNVKIPNFYMEYISDCVDITKGLLVHPYYQTGLELHLMYWISKHTPSRKADAPGYQFELNAELERMRMRNAPTVTEILSYIKQVSF